MRSQRKAAIAVTCAAFSLVVAGCSLTASAQEGAVEREAAAETVVVTSSLADGSTVNPGTKWIFTAAEGWSIQVNGLEAASKVAGGDGSGTAKWTSRPLAPGRQIDAEVVATHVDGTTRAQRFSVTTSEPKKQFGVKFGGSSSTQYGVGHMPTIEFDMPIPRKSRAAVIAGMTTTASPRNVNVAYRWLDDQSVAYRPEKFWPGKSKIKVVADLRDVAIVSGGRTYWGKAQSQTWRTARSMIIQIKADRYYGEVVIDGKKVRRFGTSVGKPGYTTRSGIKTLTEKYYLKRMTNLGVTSDEEYDLQVPYSMLMTPTGEYLHGAPWNGNIGYANTSHGCTNLNVSDAAWIYSRMKWGDPVITTGTSRSMESWNGPGGLWNISWKQWTKS